MECLSKIAGVVLLFSTLTLCGCGAENPKNYWSKDNPVSPEMLDKENEHRERLGVRQVKPDWSFRRRSATEIEWEDEQGRLAKYVRYNVPYEELGSEFDYYYSGRSFPSPDPDDKGQSPMLERITIKFYHDRAVFESTIATGDQTLSPQMFEEIDLVRAEEILDKWGISRL